MPPLQLILICFTNRNKFCLCLEHWNNFFWFLLHFSNLLNVCVEKEYVEIFVQGEHKRNSLPEIYHRKFSIISSRLPPTISFIEIKQVDMDIFSYPSTSRPTLVNGCSGILAVLDSKPSGLPDQTETSENWWGAMRKHNLINKQKKRQIQWKRQWQIH